MQNESWQEAVVKTFFSLCFVVTAQISPRDAEEKQTATAEAAVMEDKCRVEAGRLDSDGSVCEIYFKVHFRFKELELYLSPYKNTE